MKQLLTSIAKVIRSKNCSPFDLTMDIIIKDKEIYCRLKNAQAVNKKIVAKAYRIPESNIRSVIYFDPAKAVKITMRRIISSGAPGDTDVYGAQQHAPLLKMKVDF